MVTGQKSGVAAGIATCSVDRGWHPTHQAAYGPEESGGNTNVVLARPFRGLKTPTKCSRRSRGPRMLATSVRRAR